MTIIAGISASRQGTAPLNLAAQISRWTGDKVVAAAIMERPWPPKDDPVEQEYLRLCHLAGRAVHSTNGRQAAGRTRHLGRRAPISLYPNRFDGSGRRDGADLVVVGSSSSGLLGRVALGSVTDRLVHTAAVPVAIAPRGYPLCPDPDTAADRSYGGQADVGGLIRAAPSWPPSGLAITDRVVHGAADEGVRRLDRASAEDLVIQQWSRRTFEEITKQLNEFATASSVPDVEVVVGTGHDWREAVEDVSWETGDMLLLGSGAAGQTAQVFLGSAASKILRHAPVPVMIMPRHQMPA